MRAVLVLVLLVTAGVARTASAEELINQRMRFVERGTDLTVTTAITKLFDSEAYEALDSGFPSTVVIRMWVYPRASTDAVAFQLIQRQVVYDLWDEVYVMRLDEPGGRKIVREKRKADALRRLTSIDDLPIAKLAELPYEQVYLLAMQIELNPVSKETLAQVRRWLSQGTGGGLDRGGAFFGSFVSVFVNPKIPEADRVLRIRSQPFYRPKP